jgi:hypothetical protein
LTDEISLNFQCDSNGVRTKSDVYNVRIWYGVQRLETGYFDGTVEEDLIVHRRHASRRRRKRHRPQVCAEEVALVRGEIEVDSEARLTCKCVCRVGGADLNETTVYMRKLVVL